MATREQLEYRFEELHRLRQDALDRGLVDAALAYGNAAIRVAFDLIELELKQA